MKAITKIFNAYLIIIIVSLSVGCNNKDANNNKPVSTNKKLLRMEATENGQFLWSSDFAYLNGGLWNIKNYYPLSHNDPSGEVADIDESYHVYKTVQSSESTNNYPLDNQFDLLEFDNTYYQLHPWVSLQNMGISIKKQSTTEEIETKQSNLTLDSTGVYYPEITHCYFNTNGVDRTSTVVTTEIMSSPPHFVYTDPIEYYYSYKDGNVSNETNNNTGGFFYNDSIIYSTAANNLILFNNTYDTYRILKHSLFKYYNNLAYLAFSKNQVSKILHRWYYNNTLFMMEINVDTELNTNGQIDKLNIHYPQSPTNPSEIAHTTVIKFTYQ